MKPIYWLAIAAIIVLNSCITDTVDSFSTFTVQIPLFYTAIYENKACPDTSLDFSNLFEYKEYQNNKEKIDKAEIFQFNYRIDSLIMPNGEIYNPLKHDLVFDYIRYKVVFAKPKYGDEYSLNANDFEIDSTQPAYLLGEYKNVDIKDYYKQSKNILSINDDRARLISDILKHKPYFYISTEYSAIKNASGTKTNFPYLRSKFDVVVRLGVKI